MGFLTSLFGGGGGANSSSSSTGYSALPSVLQSGFNKLGTDVSQYTDPNNAANVARFTPMGQTTGETQAYNNINQGFTPTNQSLNSDLSMLMNPFNDSVIGRINNEAEGNYSILKQNSDLNGQLGSNRQQLGANDIELQRQNQIGSLLQNQYNEALSQVFNNLVPQRQQDAMNQLNAGSNQRQLDLQTKQAPISALQAGTSMIAPFTAGGTTSSSGTTPGAGPLPGIANAASAIGTGMMMFSDINLKENIKSLGKENGHNIYEFSYKGDKRRFKGVMAQEVLKINPKAVINTPKGLTVNYAMIGVNFGEV